MPVLMSVQVFGRERNTFCVWHLINDTDRIYVCMCDFLKCIPFGQTFCRKRRITALYMETSSLQDLCDVLIGMY